MFRLEQSPGRIAIVDGKEFLFFSGYNYLGMHQVPAFVDLVKEGVDRYGWLFPSSRISNTTLSLYEDFEENLSSFTGMETSVCFSSGFLAGRAVLDCLQQQDHVLYIAPGTHPAINDQNNTSLTFQQWTQQLIQELQVHKGATPVLLFDSVNPLTAEINDTSFLHQLTQPVICLIDDSHGIGILPGPVTARFPGLPNIEYIFTYSLSKAFNLVGGAVSCSAKMATAIRSTPWYTASTSISPAFAHAFLEGQHLYEQQMQKLQDNITLFNELNNHRPNPGTGLPVFILPAAASAEALAQQGIIISSFAYPDPGGAIINRVVVNALHTSHDLHQLANSLRKL